MPEILEELGSLIGEDKLEELTTTNPGLALRNKKIEISEPYPIELSLKEKIIMRFKKWGFGDGPKILISEIKK